jgi:c-di-GMP-binding flagellar brake protein YcgR
MEKEERKTKPLFGIVNFERRKHPRFSVDLPVEYWQINNCKSRPSHTVNVSEGGLLLHLSEPAEIGQNLRLNLFIHSGPDLDSIGAVVQVVWKDNHVGKDGVYPTGVKFVDISAEDMDKLKKFLNGLNNFQVPSELKIPSRLASTLANFSPPNSLTQRSKRQGR